MKKWRLPTLPPVKAVPSALQGLTSLFGMGRGEHLRYHHHQMGLVILLLNEENTNSFLGKLEGLVLLCSAVSDLPHIAYQRRHLQHLSWKSYLGEGFVLRCFQHLSLPDIATLRCSRHHNS